MTPPADPAMETPLSPLPDAAPKRTTRAKRGEIRSTRKRRARKEAPPRESGGERGPIASGFAFVFASWRVLLFIVLIQLLLGLTVVLPFWQAAAARLDHHPHASALAGSPTAYEQGMTPWAEGGMDPGIWADMKRVDKAFYDGVTTTAYWMALVAWLFGALVAGGFLGTAVAGEDPVRVGSFLSHGARLYGPMLRMGLCFALAFYVVARLVFEAWGGTSASSEFMAASEEAGFWGARLREGVVVLLFFWLRIAADLGRARMAVLGSRGAVKAFFGGLVRALRLKPILAALAFGVPVTVLLFGLGFLARELVGDDTWVLLGLFLVFQFAVFLRWAGRAAQLGAYAKLP